MSTTERDLHEVLAEKGAHHRLLAAIEGRTYESPAKREVDGALPWGW